MYSLQDDIDPAQIDELENTKSMLDFWEKQKKKLDLKFNFVLEGDDNEQAQYEYHSSEVAKVILGAAEIEAPELMVKLGSPTTKRQLLDYLNTSITVYADRVEINGLLPVRDVLYQEYNSVCRTVHYQQSG